MQQHPISQELYPLGTGHYLQARGHHMDRDSHDDYLLIYCVDGSGWLRVGAQTFEVEAGHLLILPKGLAHAYAASDTQPWTIYWVHFDGRLAEQFCLNLAVRYERPLMQVGRNAKLTADFDSLLQVRRSGYQLRPLLHTANQLRQILSYAALLRTAPSNQPGFDLDLIHSHMQANLHRQLDLDNLAALANLSKYHFAKRYKALTGTSPINHFINLKIEHSCQLLDLGVQTISEIGYAVGYDDAYYFSRIFKKVMGISPTAYRKLRLGAWPDY
nr:AraC family ligand binding domain-containing protein [Motiliproteus sediminis]